MFDKIYVVLSGYKRWNELFFKFLNFYRRIREGLIKI